MGIKVESNWLQVARLNFCRIEILHFYIFAAVSKPLSELFKAPADSWTCPTCSVSNNAGASECPCCMTKRPGGTSTAPVVTSATKALLPSSETKEPDEVMRLSGNSFGNVVAEIARQQWKDMHAASLVKFHRLGLTELL